MCTTASKTWRGAFCRSDIYFAWDCARFGLRAVTSKSTSKVWGDAMQEMTRGTQDLPLQQGSGGRGGNTLRRERACVSYCITALEKRKDKPGDELLPLHKVLRKRRVQQRD